MSIAKKQKIPKEDIWIVLERVQQQLLSLIACLSGSSEATRETMNRMNTRTEPEAIEQMQVGTGSESAYNEPSSIEELANSDLFEGTVELELPPPLRLEQMSEIHKALKHTPHIQVTQVASSKNNGINMKIYVDKPTPLIQIIGELPEAAKVYEESASDSSMKQPITTIRRIVIISKQ
jgi:hypothetical protein